MDDAADLVEQQRGHGDGVEAGGQQILAGAQSHEALAHLHGALPVRHQAVELRQLLAQEGALRGRALEKDLREPRAFAHHDAGGREGHALRLHPLAIEA